VDQKYMGEFKQVRDQLLARMNAGEAKSEEAKKN
jgi:hypothetical protein